MTLQNKVAIVTGGSRGIGRALYLGLAAEGAKVMVASRTEADASVGTEFARYAAGTIHDTARMIHDRGGAAVGVRCDVTRVEDIRSLVAATLERFGRLDIVVNNAGIDCELPVVDMDIDMVDRCLGVNVRAPLLLCKLALPSMIALQSGSIFCLTSGAARGYRPGRVGYSIKFITIYGILGVSQARRHHVWPGSGSPTYRPAPRSSWICPVAHSTSFSPWSRPLRPRSKRRGRRGGAMGHPGPRVGCPCPSTGHSRHRQSGSC